MKTIKYDPRTSLDITNFISRLYEDYYLNDEETVNISVPDDIDSYFISKLILLLSNSGYFLTNVSKTGANIFLKIEINPDLVEKNS